MNTCVALRGREAAGGRSSPSAGLSLSGRGPGPVPLHPQRPGCLCRPGGLRAGEGGEAPLDGSAGPAELCGPAGACVCGPQRCSLRAAAASTELFIYLLVNLIVY